MKIWQRSYIRNKRNRGCLYGVLVLLVVMAALLSICLGAVSVAPGEVLGVLFGWVSDTTEARIVLYSRVPRTFGCLLAGMALAVSGVVIQGVLQNPLAAPNIIGVNAGAGLLVVLWSAWMPKAAVTLPLAAFLGAFLGVMLVLFVAERTGASKITLTLAGVAVSSVFSAGIDAVVTFVPDVLNGYSDFRIGGLANLSMARVIPAAWVIVISMVVVLSLAGELDILQLGAEMAKSLGLPVKVLRLVLLALAAALAGAAVSFAGLLGFVGLIVPHIMRRLIGEESFPLLISSALGGGTMLTVCDLLARTLFAPYELSVGIVLSLVGGPFFIWLLLKQRGGRIHD